MIIDAQAVSNTGRIYGDSISVNAGALDNDVNAAGTAGVIASRGDIELGVGTLTNREGAYILANDDLRIAGTQVTNDSATIEAGGNLAIDAGRIDNLNSRFATTTTTTTDATPQYFYTTPGSDVMLPGADTWFYLNESNHLRGLMNGASNPKTTWRTQTEYWTMVLPSAQYPTARYGPPFNYDGDTIKPPSGEDAQLGKGIHSSPVPIIAGGKTWMREVYPVGLAYSPLTHYNDLGNAIVSPETFAYTIDNPIWAVFGVSPPTQMSAEPVNRCRPGDQACNAQFTAQHAQWQTDHAAAVVQYLALNDAIAAFDTDFKTRLVSNFDVITVQSQTTTEDSVTYSAPGQIVSGGDLSINGSLNNDKSQIAAGGDFNGTGPQTINADALGSKQTIAQGTISASTAQGGGRQWTSDQPYSKTLGSEVINLSILPTTPGVAPGTMRSVPIASASAPGAGGAVSVAQGTAQGASLSGVGQASGIDGVNVAAGAAGTINAPGSATVNAPSTGTLSVPNAGKTSANSASAGATASLGGEVIRTMTPPLRLPNNALYRTQSDPGSRYLIETDPAYANFKTWISSDAMISALNQSPDNVIKRIGDGFYEQQLVAQQVLSLTGQRFIGDYTNNEAEYKALLNGGVQAAQAFNLTIGTALTDAQMAALTSDIVWLVKATVTLADGTTQEVLTPQVYLHAREMDVTGTGALISGRNVSIQNSGDVNNSGTIASRGVTIVTGDNINNVNGTLAGSTLIAHANTDLTNLAGKIVADNALLTAGRDINISSQSWSATGLNTATSGIGALSTINTGNLAIGAGHDLTITASALNASGSMALAAVNDVNLKTLKLSDSSQATWDSKNQRSTAQSVDVGTGLNAGGDMSIAAGHDVNATAANVVAGQALSMAAGNDVNLNAGQESHRVSEDHYSESHGFLSRTKVTTHDANASTDALGTTLSGNTVNVSAGHDLTANAATIAGTGDVNLSAGNNITIATAATSSLDAHSKETKKSGFGSSGGLSFGTSSQKDTVHDTVGGEQGSLIGSTDGSVHMQAGNTLHVTGSDIVAAQDVTGVASNVIIDGSQTNRHHDETHESKTTGFSVTASAPVIDAAQNTLQQAGASGRSEDSRASALHAMAAASGAYDAAGAAQNLATGQAPDAKIELSWGSSSSKSTFTEDSTNHTGSTVKAGGTAAFVATGGNVDISGSDVSANNVILAAANQVNLTNSTDTDRTRSTNESKSSGVGVSIGTNGVGIDASMSKASGSANSDSQWSNNTHVNAANNATIISGGDTNLIGANVNGKSVSMDVGGDLNIASIQDTSKSDAHQKSSGGGIAISQGGASGSFSTQQGNASGNFAGVTEQSGIHAGKDGFAINVQGNTDLRGAAIASDADASKNSLTTGTLSFSDIANNSSYDAKSSGVSGGASTGDGGNTYATHGNTSGSNTGGVSPMLIQNDSGNDSATTRSAISAGTINVTDTANQKQDLASLSRDTSNTNGTVAKRPDMNDLLNRQADMMSAASAAGEVVARRIGDYAQSKYDEAKTNHDQAGMDLWKDGGISRAEMQAAGAAVVAGLGGGAGNAVAGAAGAGMASLAAGKLNGLSDAIAGASPTGNPEMDKALGNIVANVVATGAGYVAGNAGALEAGNVDLYNRTAHEDTNEKKPKDLVAQVCPAPGQCNDATLNAVILAQGMNADAAAANLQTTGAYGAPVAALALIGPEAVAAAILAGGFDYEGDAVSYAVGLSKDKPDFTKSYITGIVNGAMYPFAMADGAIAAMGTAGKVAANTYNAGVAGVTAFGSAAITHQSSPDASASFGAGAAGLGGAVKTLFPGKMGNFLNNVIQGLSGPFQNAVTPPSKK
jgi:filamentous hemagglutinin